MTVNRGGIVKAVRVPQLRGATDQAWANSSIEDTLRNMAARIEDLQRQTTQGGMAPVLASTLEGRPEKYGIVAGRLVHVRDDGVVQLAVNTDESLYCTHVVSDVFDNGQVKCFGYGHYMVSCLPFVNVGSAGPLYLSDIPGHATDVPPEGAAVYQRIGERMMQPANGSSLAFAVFKPEFFPTSSTEPDYPVTSVNDQTGDVDLWLRHLRDVSQDDVTYLAGDGSVLTFDENITKPGIGGTWTPKPIQQVIISGGAFTPTTIASGSTFTVPVNSQVLFCLPIEGDGVLKIDGALVEVD